MAALVASALEATGLAGLFVFFQVAMTPPDGEVPSLVRVTHAALGAPDQTTFLTVLASVVAIAFVIRAGVLLATTWLGLAFRRHLQIGMTQRLFRAYLLQPVEWHIAQGQARLLNNVASNIGQVAQHVIVASLDILASVLLLTAVLLTLLAIQPLGTLSAFAVVAVAGWLFLRVMRPLLDRWGTKSVQVQEALYRSVREPLRGIKTIKVMGETELFAREVDRATAASMALQLRRGLVLQAPRLVLEALVVIAVLLGIIVALNMGVAPAELVPTMALFAAAAIRMMPHATQILGHLQYMRMSEAPLRAIRHDVITLSSDVRSGPPASSPRLFRSLKLDRVGFVYAGSKRGLPAIDGISLELRPGELVALVGPSGSGKTTLVDVMLGLLEPTSGRLFLDGRPVERFPSSFFAYVPQESFVVQASLVENVTFGLTTASDDGVTSAIAQAGLAGLVERLPEGLQTVLNEEGNALSGGEKQRIGIARALVRDAPIIVLDEPTSALDALTEATVTATIEQLRGHRTVIMIAHRLSSIQRFDRIIFMAEGRVLGQGTFAEVYRDCPDFARMVDIMALDGYAGTVRSELSEPLTEAERPCAQ